MSEPEHNSGGSFRSLSPGQVATLLDSITDGLFTVDLEWRVTWFNRAAEKITGIPSDEAVGKPCCDVFRASICEGNCALRHTMDTGKPISSLAIYIINADGDRVPISISTALLRDADGEVIGGVEMFRDLSQVEELRKEIARRHTFADIISKNHRMQQLFNILPEIAASDTTVLIQGDSGTGKELFARAIHYLSPRKDGPFVAVSCGALPDTLLESELFGYKAGAFTDARDDKPGRFALADRGTVFLDEIGDISPAMQVRLLRVLQERTFEPLGGTETVQANVRVIAASNRDLSEMVEKDKFRRDLFYRINVVRLVLPPLRERRDDIPLLVDHFVARFNRLRNKDIAGVSPEVLAVLMRHEFPGNVRELENIIEHAFVLCAGGMIEVHHLPEELHPARQTALPLYASAGPAGTLAEVERQLIIDALKRNGWNRLAAARELGIHKSTLFRKVKTLGIELPKRDGRSSGY